MRGRPREASDPRDRRSWRAARTCGVDGERNGRRPRRRRAVPTSSSTEHVRHRQRRERETHDRRRILGAVLLAPFPHPREGGRIERMHVLHSDGVRRRRRRRADRTNERKHAWFAMARIARPRILFGPVVALRTRPEAARSRKCDRSASRLPSSLVLRRGPWVESVRFAGFPRCIASPGTIRAATMFRREFLACRAADLFLGDRGMSEEADSIARPPGRSMKFAPLLVRRVARTVATTTAAPSTGPSSSDPSRLPCTDAVRRSFVRARTWRWLDGSRKSRHLAVSTYLRVLAFVETNRTLHERHASVAQASILPHLLLLFSVFLSGSFEPRTRSEETDVSSHVARRASTASDRSFGVETQPSVASKERSNALSLRQPASLRSTRAVAPTHPRSLLPWSSSPKGGH